MRKTLLIFMVILIIPVNLYAAPSITTTVKIVGEIAEMVMTLRQAGYSANVVESHIINYGKITDSSLKDLIKILIKGAYQVPREELLTKQLPLIKAYKTKWEAITLLALTQE